MPAGDVREALKRVEEQRQLRSTGRAHRRVASTSWGQCVSKRAPPIARATRPQRQRGARSVQRECALCPPLEIRRRRAWSPRTRRARGRPLRDHRFLLSDGTVRRGRQLSPQLRSRHPELAQRRPLDALGTGDFNYLFEAAEQPPTVPSHLTRLRPALSARRTPPSTTETTNSPASLCRLGTGRC